MRSGFIRRPWGFAFGESKPADGGAPWTPASLPNLVLWLRKGVGLTDAGGRCAAWADQSGNGNNVANASAGTQPLIVGSALQFTSARNDFLAIGLLNLGASEITMAVRARADANSTFYPTILGYNAYATGSNAAGLGLDGSSTNVRTIGAGNVVCLGGDIATGFHRVIGTCANTGGGTVAVTTYTDGVAATPGTGTGSLGASGDLQIGVASTFTLGSDITLEEVVICGAAIDATNAALLDTYLAGL